MTYREGKFTRWGESGVVERQAVHMANVETVG